MKCIIIQPFVLKAGESINDQINNNDPNAKLKSLYKAEMAVWMLKYGNTKFLPQHMNSILVEAWDAFKVSSGNIIRYSFEKKIYPPQPYRIKKNPRHVLPPSKYLLEPRLNKSTIHHAKKLHLLRYK